MRRTRWSAATLVVGNQRATISRYDDCALFGHLSAYLFLVHSLPPHTSILHPYPQSSRSSIFAGLCFRFFFLICSNLHLAERPRNPIVWSTFRRIRALIRTMEPFSSGLWFPAALLRRVYRRCTSRLHLYRCARGCANTQTFSVFLPRRLAARHRSQTPAHK